MNLNDTDRHLVEFAGSFVIGTGRDRWVNFLSKRPSRIFRKSHKLYDVLDPKKCVIVHERPPIPDETVGVFYDFYSEPKKMSFFEAFAEGQNHDAIFSIEPGKLAVFFFHEGEEWLCTA